MEEDYLSPLSKVIQSILQIVIYVAVIFFLISPYISIGVFVLAVLGVIASRVAKNNASSKRKCYLETNAKYIGFVRQVLSGFNVIRKNNLKKVYLREEEASENVANKRMSYGKSKAFLLSYNNAVSYFKMLLFFVYIVFLAYAGKISMSVAIVSFGYIDLVMEPINTVLEAISTLKTLMHLFKIN